MSSQLAARPVTAAPPGHTRSWPARHRWWVLAVIGIAQLMVVLDATIMSIALPSAQQALHFTDDGRQWIVTAYSLAFGSLLLLGGRLSDLFGRRTTFIIGIVGFAGASAVGGAATSFTMLVAARTTQGVFGALLAPAALSLLTTTFTAPKERAKAFGIYGAIAGSGAAIGLVLGGLLTEYLDWRWTLYVNVIIAVFALAGALIFLRRSVPAERPKLDIPGVLLVAAGLFCVVYGFSNASTHSWSSWLTWGFLATSAVLLLAFFLWQAKGTHPLLPLRVLADRNRGAALAAVLVSSAGMFGVFLFLTYYMQGTLGYSPVKNGVAYLPMVGIMMVTSQLATNWLAPRLGPKVIVPVGMLLAAGGMVWLTGLGLDSSYAAHVLPPLLLIGLGLGLTMPTAMSRATLGVRMIDQGVASATTNTTQQVGGSISTALLNTLAATAAIDYARIHRTDPLVQANAALHSYSVTYWWSAGFFVFGAIVTVLLFRRKGDSVPAIATVPAQTPPAHTTNGSAAAHTVPPAAVVHGQVLDAAGAPLPHAVVTLIDPAGRQLARATAHEDGSYAVVAPERGSLILVASAPGREPQVTTLAVGGTPVSHDLVMLTGPKTLAGTVRGTVRDRDGRPLSDARITLLDAASNVIAARSTADDGTYCFNGLTDTEYALIASGYAPVTASISLNGNTHNSFDLVLGHEAT
jgi:EmrB/QacA subfamily drug resistance transporter